MWTSGILYYNDKVVPSPFSRLQDLYKSILLTDLESALDKKVEQDL